MANPGFHVVQVKFWGHHQGYEIYHTGFVWEDDVGFKYDAPVVEISDGVALKRHEAYRLARAWNG